MYAIRSYYEGNPEARRYPQLDGIHEDRLVHGLEKPRDNGARGGHIGQVHEHGDEFVPPKSGQGIAVTKRELHAPGEFRQQFVSRLVPMGIVDRLKAVKIEVGDCHMHTPARGLRHRLDDPVLQKEAIGKARERVIMGDFFELALVFLQGRDI